MTAEEILALSRERIAEAWTRENKAADRGDWDSLQMWYYKRHALESAADEIERRIKANQGQEPQS
jgi:hypothetical protein